MNSNQIIKQELKLFSTELINPSPYYFGNDIINDFMDALEKYDYDKIYFISNQELFNIYGNDFTTIFDGNDIQYQIIFIKDAEEDKTFSNLEFLCEKLVQNDITKSSIIIAFGGGCLGNIVGLAAGLIFRGIRYIEIPTTLMSITDSTLSNKQAVNGKEGKNLFGIYYAPIFIWGDVKYLVSEKLDNTKAALVEGIKNSFISDEHLMYFYKDILKDKNQKYSAEELYEIAYRIIQSKLKILKKDPTEKKYAIILEYGHTFGHAIEWLTNGRIIHGLAVAKGMCIAAELSYKLGYISQDILEEHYTVLRDILGLNITIPNEISVQDIMNTIANDNKKNKKGITYVLLDNIGKCLKEDGNYEVYVDSDVVEEVLAEYLAKN